MFLRCVLHHRDTAAGESQDTCVRTIRSYTHLNIMSHTAGVAMAYAQFPSLFLPIKP